jgi:transcriptional regulator with XRE-family HTH domain
MPTYSSISLTTACGDAAADPIDGTLPMRGSLISDEAPAPRARFRMRELDSHIGRRIREARAESCLSMQALGDRIGLTYQQVQKYEAGTDRLSVAVLLELARIFARPFDWFCGPFMPRPDSCWSTIRPTPSSCSVPSWRPTAIRWRARRVAATPWR